MTAFFRPCGSEGVPREWALAQPTGTYSMGFVHEGTSNSGDSALPGAGRTRWTLILQAAHHGTPTAGDALEALARQYWQPLYVYVRRRIGNDDEPQDIVQAFFERKVLKNRLLDRADKAAGSFRWLLKCAMDGFLIDGWRSKGAQKRGGDVAVESLHTEGAQMFLDVRAEEVTPDEAYDLAWALRVMLLAMDALQRASTDPSIPEILAFLRAGAPSSEQAALAKRLGISANSLSQKLHRIRLEKLPPLIRRIIWDQCDGSPRLVEEGWDVLCRYVPQLRVLRDA